MGFGENTKGARRIGGISSVGINRGPFQAVYQGGDSFLAHSTPGAGPYQWVVRIGPKYGDKGPLRFPPDGGLSLIGNLGKTVGAPRSGEVARFAEALGRSSAATIQTAIYRPTDSWGDKWTRVRSPPEHCPLDTHTVCQCNFATGQLTTIGAKPATCCWLPAWPVPLEGNP